MHRLLLSLVCCFPFALPVLLVGGCASTRTTIAGNGGGNSPSSGGGPIGGATSACGSGSDGYGYNNQNGTISGVWMQAPNPGANPSHVQVEASASTSSTFTKWMVCLDDEPVYHRWVLNGIPCPHWSAGWHHVRWYVERINSTQYRYDTLVLDGQAYGLNQTWNFNDTSWQDMVGIQYQLDQDTSGTPLHEWVDDVTLTKW